MSTKTFCDRCEVEIKPVKAQLRTFRLELTDELLDLGDDSSNTVTVKELVLCDSCRKAVSQFLNEKPFKARVRR